MTDKTQAHLPVTPTQADHDAANAAMDAMEGALGNRRLVLAQAFARHRISHSLPGDVGTDAIKKIVYRAYCAGFNDRPGDQFWNDREADFDAAIAALTPSPCPGDGK